MAPTMGARAPKRRVEDIAGVKLKRRDKLDAPKGVRGRNSDNTLIKDSRRPIAPSLRLQVQQSNGGRQLHWLQVDAHENNAHLRHAR